MMINIARRLLVFFAIAGTLSSCWEDFTEREFNSANVLSFTFDQHDSVPGIEDYVFNIDQFSGRIYNLDSMPYMTDVTMLSPSISLQSSNGELYLNDSLWDGKRDTLDFTNPVVLKNTSADGKYTRTYTININVHQVDPDSMLVTEVSTAFPKNGINTKIAQTAGGSMFCLQINEFGIPDTYYSNDLGLTWTKSIYTGLPANVKSESLTEHNNKLYITTTDGLLYSSENGQIWTSVLTDKKVYTLLGSIKKKYMGTNAPYSLIGLAYNVSGQLCYSRSDDGTNWETGDEVDADFPVLNYSIVKGSSVTNTQFLTITSGNRQDGAYSKSLLSTDNGLEWVIIKKSATGSDLYTANKSGITLFYYDSYLVAFGGRDSGGNYLSELKVSKDHGKNWISAPENWIFKSLENGLTRTNIYVQSIPDNDYGKDREFIWIYGGLSNSGLSSKVSKAYLNKMVFARR